MRRQAQPYRRRSMNRKPGATLSAMKRGAAAGRSNPMMMRQLMDRRLRRKRKARMRSSRRRS